MRVIVAQMAHIIEVPGLGQIVIMMELGALGATKYAGTALYFSSLQQPGSVCSCVCNHPRFVVRVALNPFLFAGRVLIIALAVIAHVMVGEALIHAALAAHVEIGFSVVALGFPSFLNLP